MHPGIYAAKMPDRPAYIMAESGQTVSWKELDDGSNRFAQLFHAEGLRVRDGIAILLENHPSFFEVCWAAQRSGLYYTAISYRLRAAEVEYIVKNCGAKVFITSYAQREVAEKLAAHLDGVRCLMFDGTIPGFEAAEEAALAMPAQPLAEQIEGQSMLFSSGTTGYPKGVKREIAGTPLGEDTVRMQAMVSRYGMDEDTRYLSPAPLYHAAPLGYTMAVLRLGGTVVVMEHFDAEAFLHFVEEYKITHTQLVPTMFVRMLRLPEDVRNKYDLSTLKVAIHAAAPCPIPIKEQMIAWWGPIIYEYYAGTEGNGSTFLTSEEWLGHKGSVGRPLNVKVHILDDEGNELPPYEIGHIYFEGGGSFEYHDDPEKTASAYNDKGWSTLGDIGYVDEDEYLYLTDRKANMIISGGVNIYPQETENVLINHPKVHDVAVFGVPNEDFGEEVKAVVQPVDMAEAGPGLEAELIAFCKEHMSSIKCPRSVDFEAELPRHPTGKLYKRLLKDRYWQDRPRQIA